MLILAVPFQKHAYKGLQIRNVNRMGPVRGPLQVRSAGTVMEIAVDRTLRVR